MHCDALAPSIRHDSSVLILGSMPGVRSLTKQQYYAYPQNRFWRMMSQIFGETLPKSYHARLNMLLTHGVALWDTIAACERDGSLDSAIKNIVPANIAALLSMYPHIRKICCNGGKAYAVFKKYNAVLLARDDLHVYALPSTSPANRRWSADDLLETWHAAITDKT